MASQCQKVAILSHGFVERKDLFFVDTPVVKHELNKLVRWQWSIATPQRPLSLGHRLNGEDFKPRPDSNSNLTAPQRLDVLKYSSYRLKFLRLRLSGPRLKVENRNGRHQGTHRTSKIAARFSRFSCEPPWFCISVAWISAKQVR